MKITLSDETQMDVVDIQTAGTSSIQIILEGSLDETIIVFTNKDKMKSITVENGSMFNGFTKVGSIKAESDGITTTVTAVMVNEDISSSLSKIRENYDLMTQNLQGIVGKVTDGLNEIKDLTDAVMELGDLLSELPEEDAEVDMEGGEE